MVGLQIGGLLDTKKGEGRCLERKHTNPVINVVRDLERRTESGLRMRISWVGFHES